jgi:superfamily II DNA or RNA helicase
MKKDPRNEIHRRGLNNWARNNFRGILLYGTGSGKTYCGIRALEYFLSKNDSARFLIVTPTYTIIENWNQNRHRR